MYQITSVVPGLYSNRSGECPEHYLFREIHCTPESRPVGKIQRTAKKHEPTLRFWALKVETNHKKFKFVNTESFAFCGHWLQGGWGRLFPGFGVFFKKNLRALILFLWRTYQRHTSYLTQRLFGKRFKRVIRGGGKNVGSCEVCVHPTGKLTPCLSSRRDNAGDKEKEAKLKKTLEWGVKEGPIGGRLGESLSCVQKTKSFSARPFYSGRACLQDLFRQPAATGAGWQIQWKACSYKKHQDRVCQVQLLNPYTSLRGKNNLLCRRFQ